MKENNILGVSMYSFDCETTLVDEVFQEVKNLEYAGNEKNAISMETVYYNEKLFIWFEECLEEVRKKYYIDSVKLDIVACWANKTNLTQSHHFHKHPNSIVSGIFYLTEGTGGNTCFFMKDPWLHCTDFLNINKESVPQTNMIKSVVEPKKGRLLLFPSSIEHSVSLYKSTVPRFTIAFNTFVSGDLSNGNNSTLLKLKSESVKKKYET